MNELTVIIPFLNEGREIYKTLASIRHTAGERVDILLVNDWSDDRYDYEEWSKFFGTSYIRNDHRRGVAESRNIGVRNIQTEYFLIIDGHMRFYDDQWVEKLLSNLKQDERAIYCCKCRPLDVQGNLIQNKPSFGAFVGMDNQVLLPQWIREDIHPDEKVVKIPCILGASYAGAKSYWEYLKGLDGLLNFGYDETYLSIKVWLEGGYCYLLKDVEIGHKFRDIPPYSLDQPKILFNKLLILETLFTEDHKERIYNMIRKESGTLFRDAQMIYLDYLDEIERLRSYYDGIRTRDFDSFLSFNGKYSSLNQIPVCRI
ncbi:glycosyltransferase family 2 protein [uncultured Parabacteroides sp.]|uniref:glycosyltransferase family 2 protein n=1 Tax=uncultured Parabacteroides sp. TaxID=512312 RepID=UPI0026158AB5|nr:glycosyltransferase family 2 protein [uncultured Parabacteroides sp.]